MPSPASGGRDGALADHVRIRHLGTVQPAEGGLWPSLEVVEHAGSGRLALVLMTGGAVRQLGEATSHDEALDFANQILSLKGEMIPAMLHKLALAYVALHCQGARAREHEKAGAAS